MSLFANDRFQWRETYSVLFDSKRRIKVTEFQAAIADLAKKIEVTELLADDEGYLESCTIFAHSDSAGMDIVYVEGEEVTEQLAELRKDWRRQPFDADEKAKAAQAMLANARYDVFHFEELGDAFLDQENEDEVLDPVTLLRILSKLTRLTQGVSIDPQAGFVL